MTTPAVDYRLHQTKVHFIRSSIVSQSFRIRVLLPVSRSDNTEKFSVVYVSDGDIYFDALAALTAELQFFGETPRFILVGIGYENAGAARLLRMRDFYTPEIRVNFQNAIEQFASSPLVEGLADLREITQTTGASEFLQFFRRELKPFIGAHYPALPDDDSYFGFSSGGAFGLYALFSYPEMFRRYILGSPVSSFGGQHFGIGFAEAFIRSGRRMDAKVFLSAGELEEFGNGLDRFDILTGTCLMAKFLKRSLVPGLELTMRIFPGDTHATAWAAAFIHGLKALFAPAKQVPYRPDFLQ